MSPINHLLNSDQEIPSATMSSNSVQRSPMSSDDELSSSGGSGDSSRSLVQEPSSLGSSGTFPTSPSDTLTDTEEEESHSLVCKWDSCDVEFTHPELLYQHLCQDHVGRKSQKNLQLNCRWGTCKTTTVKRDHITSHLRVHVPLKPFSCSTCTRRFKRPQDLKKHLKVHMDDAVKGKRGPKVGSKRVKKPNNAQTGVNSSLDMNVRTLPSLSLEGFVREKIGDYYPYYSHPRLLNDSISRIVLPPPTTSVANTPANRPFSPLSQTRNAVTYFTALSNDMSRRSPAHLSQQYHQQQQQQQQQQQHHHHHHHHHHHQQHQIAPSPIHMSNPLQTQDRNLMHLSVSELPPLGTGTHATNSVVAFSNLHSGYSSPPILVPQLPALNRFSQDQPLFAARQTFSLNQKASLESSDATNDEDEEFISKLEGLSLLNRNDDDTLFDDLQTVNIIKDYLTCLLLEEELDNEFPGEQNEDIIGLPYDEGLRPITLRKYPQVKA